jgi:myosin heavy subunit
MCEVWVPDAVEVYLPATTLGPASSKGIVQCQMPDGSVRDELLEKLPLRNPDAGPDGTTDMSSLDYLHEAAVLHNLKGESLK